jgi:hypothetical protein
VGLGTTSAQTLKDSRQPLKYVDERDVQSVNYYGGDGPFIYTSQCRCRLNLISNKICIHTFEIVELEAIFVRFGWIAE